jgi:hypothetical protein
MFSGSCRGAVDHADFPDDLKHAPEHDRPEIAGRATAIRTPAWTYVHRISDVDELYDRTTDPDERHDVAADPAHSGTVAELRTTMPDWLMTTADAVPADADPRFDAIGASGAEPAQPGTTSTRSRSRHRRGGGAWVARLTARAHRDRGGQGPRPVAASGDRSTQISGRRAAAPEGSQPRPDPEDGWSLVSALHPVPTGGRRCQ